MWVPTGVKVVRDFVSIHATGNGSLPPSEPTHFCSRAADVANEGYRIVGGVLDCERDKERPLAGGGYSTVAGRRSSGEGALAAWAPFEVAPCKTITRSLAAVTPKAERLTALCDARGEVGTPFRQKACVERGA